MTTSPVTVSILTQFVSWVRQASSGSASWDRGVSILTQFVSWVRLVCDDVDRCVTTFQSSPNLSPGCDAVETLERRAAGCFNPHPICLLGATMRAAVDLARSRCFNPHPSCLLGATTLRAVFHDRHVVVSILTQFVSWVRRCDAASRRTHGSRRFNPHPSCLLGATQCRSLRSTRR